MKIKVELGFIETFGQFVRNPFWFAGDGSISLTDKEPIVTVELDSISDNIALQLKAGVMTKTLMIEKMDYNALLSKINKAVIKNAQEVIQVATVLEESIAVKEEVSTIIETTPEEIKEEEVSVQEDAAPVEDVKEERVISNKQLKSLMNSGVANITKEVKTIDSIELLNRILSAENSGKARPEVIEAIENRIVEITLVK